MVLEATVPIPSQSARDGTASTKAVMNVGSGFVEAGRFWPGSFFLVLDF
jgi:hypothetical protein